MPNKTKKANNMRLAVLFVVLVLGLVIFSAFFKLVFLIKDSKFDGAHKFNVEFIANNKVSVVSFSPYNKSLTILDINREIDSNNLPKLLAIPIDGKLFLKDNLTKNNLSYALIKSIFSLGNSAKDITIIDLIRLSLFSKTVPDASIVERELSNTFNDAQRSTILSLSFTDPTIYEENQTIEVINSTDIYGLGGGLANLISHIGGNVVLVSSGGKKENNSKITYSGDLTYTVKKLSSYLNFPIEQTTSRGIADVIIVIGTDKAEKGKF